MNNVTTTTTKPEIRKRTAICLGKPSETPAKETPTPTGKDLEIYVGETTKAEDQIQDFEETWAKDGWRAEYKTTPDTSKPGTVKTVVVLKKDGEADIEVDVNIIVKEIVKESPISEDQTIWVGETPSPEAQVRNFEELYGKDGWTAKYKTEPDNSKPGTFDVIVILSKENEADIEVNAKLIIKEKKQETATLTTQETSQPFGGIFAPHTGIFSPAGLGLIVFCLLVLATGILISKKANKATKGFLATIAILATSLISTLAPIRPETTASATTADPALPAAGTDGCQEWGWSEYDVLVEHEFEYSYLAGRFSNTQGEGLGYIIDKYSRDDKIVFYDKFVGTGNKAEDRKKAESLIRLNSAPEFAKAVENMKPSCSSETGSDINYHIYCQPGPNFRGSLTPAVAPGWWEGQDPENNIYRVWYEGEPEE